MRVVAERQRQRQRQRQYMMPQEVGAWSWFALLLGYLFAFCARFCAVALICAHFGGVGACRRNGLLERDQDFSCLGAGQYSL